ncbi:MAG: hypothetical protein HKN22_06745 [Bacteroidia bacterium]|nr:hypothetical protein [Bacteroidia bacterium]
MEIPKEISDILFFLAPALLVFGMAYLLVKKFLDNTTRLKMFELKRLLQKDILPQRLQAYERMILFLERISPNNLLVNTYQKGMTVEVFKKELLRSIQSEFQHNVTQQLYMSHEVWLHVKKSKEELVKLIIQSSAQLKPGDPGIALSKVIFSKIMDDDESPTTIALLKIKAEVVTLF